MVFSSRDFDHEMVVFGADPATGLRAIIAIHSTKLGPALGGCRMWPYANEDEALKDVLRLSRGMTFKAALANLSLGGGKCVIIGDAKTIKTPDLFRSLGAFVERLCGQYIVAEDVGTTVEDMSYIHEKTTHVVGVSQKEGGSGDPSIFTALGVLKGIQASMAYREGSPSLQGKHVIVQGLGNVGRELCKLLHKEGASLSVFDIQAERMQEMVDAFGATPLKGEDVYSTQADILAPCALGAILNAETIPQLKVGVIAGSANNQLRTTEDGQLLRERGILYAPDYVVNAGGLINVSYEGPGYAPEKALKHLDVIPTTLGTIFDMASAQRIPTSQAADQLAMERVANAKSRKV